jgi:hypothetical protein
LKRAVDADRPSGDERMFLRGLMPSAWPMRGDFLAILGDPVEFSFSARHNRSEPLTTGAPERVWVDA